MHFIEFIIEFILSLAVIIIILALFIIFFKDYASQIIGKDTLCLAFSLI